MTSSIPVSALEQPSSSPTICIPDEWAAAGDTIAYDSNTSLPPIALICGAKNCGKTTFSRYLINVLLRRFSFQLFGFVFDTMVGSWYRRVGYLDTDDGQPEFTTPGFLSLTVVDELTSDAFYLATLLQNGILQAT